MSVVTLPTPPSKPTPPNKPSMDNSRGVKVNESGGQRSDSVPSNNTDSGDILDNINSNNSGNNSNNISADNNTTGDKAVNSSNRQSSLDDNARAETAQGKNISASVSTVDKGTVIEGEPKTGEAILQEFREEVQREQAQRTAMVNSADNSNDNNNSFEWMPLLEWGMIIASVVIVAMIFLSFFLKRKGEETLTISPAPTPPNTHTQAKKNKEVATAKLPPKLSDTPKTKDSSQISTAKTNDVNEERPRFEVRI